MHWVTKLNPDDIVLKQLTNNEIINTISEKRILLSNISKEFLVRNKLKREKLGNS